MTPSRLQRGAYVENLIVTRALTLEGAGSASTFIDGGAAASVIDINVFGGPEVIITDLTIQNGSADKGAGIYAATSVTINNAVITQTLRPTMAAASTFTMAR